MHCGRVHGALIDCNDHDPCTQDRCDDGCRNETVPAGTCLVAAKSSLQVTDRVDDARDQINWKWRGGPAVVPGDLGDPNATTTYRLCIYDAAAGARAVVGTLGIAPAAAWTAKGLTGWSYREPGGSEDGLVVARLRTGVAGKSQVQLKARGVGVPMPTPVGGSRFFQQDPDVTVQLFNDATATCWSSVFGGAIANDGMQFKAKTP